MWDSTITGACSSSGNSHSTPMTWSHKLFPCDRSISNPATRAAVISSQRSGSGNDSDLNSEFDNRNNYNSSNLHLALIPLDGYIAEKSDRQSHTGDQSHKKKYKDLHGYPICPYIHGKNNTTCYSPSTITESPLYSPYWNGLQIYL